MIFHTDYNPNVLCELAKKCESKQLRADVSAFNRFMKIDPTKKPYILYSEAGFLIGFLAKGKPLFRIFGIGTTIDYRGKGYGTAMLKKAMDDARCMGYEYAETVSTDGLSFYLRNGFEIQGFRGWGCLLKKTFVNGKY